MKLVTTDTQHHALWSAINAVRETSTTVKVDKDALRALLVDHGDMVGRLEKITKVETAP